MPIEQRVHHMSAPAGPACTAAHAQVDKVGDAADVPKKDRELFFFADFCHPTGAASPCPLTPTPLSPPPPPCGPLCFSGHGMAANPRGLYPVAFMPHPHGMPKLSLPLLLLLLPPLPMPPLSLMPPLPLQTVVTRCWQIC